MQKGFAYLFTAIVLFVGVSSLIGLSQKNSESGPTRLRFDDAQSQSIEVIKEPKVARSAKPQQKTPNELIKTQTSNEQSRELPLIEGVQSIGGATSVDAFEAAEREEGEQLMNEIIKEMQETHAGWRAIRDAAYDEMKLDELSQEKLLGARSHMEIVFDRLAGSKGTIPQEAVDSIEIAQKKYDQYVLNVLGQERYSYLNWLRDSYNSEIQHQTKHVTRVADDW